MSLDEDKIIETIIKLPIDIQNQRLRFFSKVNLKIKLLILQKQNQIFYQLRNQNEAVPKHILTLASLILAIQWKFKKMNEIDINTITLRMKQVRKKNKKNKLLTYWAVVKELKEGKKMSFRDISQYLKKFHKFEISHSTIFEHWHEIENTRNKYETSKS